MCNFIFLKSILLQIGSTEWVEENKEMLASRAIAYLNVDCAAGGPGFHASTTPQLDEIIKQATKKVSDCPFIKSTAARFNYSSNGPQKESWI